eukprot:PRCOL_00001363-RA
MILVSRFIPERVGEAGFDPLRILEGDSSGGSSGNDGDARLSALPVVAAAAAAALVPEVLSPASAAAASAKAAANIDPFFTFTPVCPYSDGVFRGGQKLALFVAGNDNIEDYRPLINDVLIRVRTELCVLESFTRETAVPFVQEKGVGWVLPLHETSETYLAGVVFMVGANFILLGSTKVVAILAIYHDLVLGLPTRTLSGLLGLAGVDEAARADKEIEALLDKQGEEMKALMSDRALDRDERERRTAEITASYSDRMESLRSGADEAMEKRSKSAVGKAMSAATALSVPLGVYGKLSSKLREVLELFDTFCSRYFVAVTVFYVIIKSVHFVLFPDIFG